MVILFRSADCAKRGERDLTPVDGLLCLASLGRSDAPGFPSQLASTRRHVSHRLRSKSPPVKIFSFQTRTRATEEEETCKEKGVLDVSITPRKPRSPPAQRIDYPIVCSEGGGVASNEARHD